MPVILGDFPKNSGEVTPVAAGTQYFPGLRQVDDPSKSNVTTAQGLQTQFSNRAIVDAQGNVILANPAPGKLGTLGQRWIEGPDHVRFDANLVKRIRIDERKNFEIRVDVRNILNTPWWSDPDTNINSLNFGKMTGSGTTGANNADINSGARSFTLNARVNF